MEKACGQSRLIGDLRGEGVAGTRVGRGESGEESSCEPAGALGLRPEGPGTLMSVRGGRSVQIGFSGHSTLLHCLWRVNFVLRVWKGWRTCCTGP